MPYAPGIEYHGDQYLYSGLAGMGRGIAEGVSEWRKKRDEQDKQLGEADAIVDFARKQGMLSPEQDTKYLGGSVSQKAGMADELSREIVLGQHEHLKQMELDNSMKVAQAHIAAQLAAANISSDSAMKVAQAHIAGQLEAAKIAHGTPISDMDFEAARKYASDHGILAMPTGDRRGVVYMPDPNQKVEYNLGKPGTVYKHPTTGEPLGIIKQDGNIEFYPSIDPQKAAIAAAMAKGAENLGGAGNGGGFDPLGFGSRMFGKASNAVGGALGNLLGGGGGEAAAPAAQAPAQAAAPADQGVKVKNPQGKTFLIPSQRLQDYIDAGWTKVEG